MPHDHDHDHQTVRSSEPMSGIPPWLLELVLGLPMRVALWIREAEHDLAMQRWADDGGR